MWIFCPASPKLSINIYIFSNERMHKIPSNAICIDNNFAIMMYIVINLFLIRFDFAAYLFLILDKMKNEK